MTTTTISNRRHKAHASSPTPILPLTTTFITSYTFLSHPKRRPLLFLLFLSLLSTLLFLIGHSLRRTIFFSSSSRRHPHHTSHLPASSALHHASAPIVGSAALGLPSSFLDPNYFLGSQQLPLQQQLPNAAALSPSQHRQWVYRQIASDPAQFATLYPPSEIDYTLPRRLPHTYSNVYTNHEFNHNINNMHINYENSNEQCKEILLFLPHEFARHGHASQLNNYLLAVLISTFLGKAMVVLDLPYQPPGSGSRNTHEDVNHANINGNNDLPSNSYDPNNNNAFQSNKQKLKVEPLHAKTAFPNGSQFGCPIDAFLSLDEFFEKIQTGRRHTHLDMKPDFPSGLERLIVHPEWLSRGCDVPCIDEITTYGGWEEVRKGVFGNSPKVKCGGGEVFYGDGVGKNGKNKKLKKKKQNINNNSNVEKNDMIGGERDDNYDNADENENDKTNVLVLGGEQLRKYFLRQYQPRMLAAHDPKHPLHIPGLAYNWALRLGARHHEAETFASLRDERDVWDYVSALLARSGIMTFQPWIVRDVMEFIKSSELPLDGRYDAMHVRRGDKLEMEAAGEVREYWMKRGYREGDRFPTNYIPLEEYLKRLNDGLNANGGIRRAIASGSASGSESVVGNGVAKCHGNNNSDHNSDPEIKLVYIATDDAPTIQSEISKLPKGRNGAYLINGGCQHVKFIFNPAAAETTQFHLNDGGAIGDCFERYTRNIQAIADMMIVVRSETFVGEFNSNWGRFARIFRMFFNDGLNFAGEGGLGNGHGAGSAMRTDVVVKDFRVAFGPLEPDPPGW